MKHLGMYSAALLLGFALLACQFAAGLPIPGLRAAGVASDSGRICDREPDLGFDIEAASRAPTCAADCTEMGPELGRDGAAALAAELTPTDTFCSLDVSAETQAAIDRALELNQQGRIDEALDLLTERISELEGLTSHGAPLAMPSQISSGGRQAVADLLNLGYQAGLLGGDDAPFLNAAQSVFHDYASRELPGADLRETLNIEAEATLLADDEIAERAHQQAVDIAEREYQEAAARLDPCTVTKDDLKTIMNKVATAMLLGVPSANEDDNPAFANLLQTIARAAAAVKNKESGKVAEGCEVKGELEIIYTQQAVAGQSEPIVVKTVVPFALDLKEEPPGDSADAKLFNDQVYTYPELTVHNLVDFDLQVNSWFVGGSAPLQVDLGITGSSGLTVGQMQLWHSPDYDELVTLNFPLVDGAVQEFDLEGWKDFKEWKVTLHLPSP
jgi:hypothetical protein